MRNSLIILGQLSDADALWIAQSGRRRSLDRGDVLIREGQANRELFLILDGHATVAVRGHVVAELGHGEMLGEMALIDRNPPAATVTAQDTLTVLALPKDLLENRARTSPDFAARFYRAVAVLLSDRLRQMNDKAASHTSGRLEDEVEIDDAVLDRLHLAGKRFEIILNHAASSAAQAIDA